MPGGLPDCLTAPLPGSLALTPLHSLLLLSSALPPFDLALSPSDAPPLSPLLTPATCPIRALLSSHQSTHCPSLLLALSIPTLLPQFSLRPVRTARLLGPSFSRVLGLPCSLPLSRDLSRVCLSALHPPVVTISPLLPLVRPLSHPYPVDPQAFTVSVQLYV